MQTNLHVWGMDLPSAKEAKAQVIRIETEAFLKKAKEDEVEREKALNEVVSEIHKAISAGRMSVEINKHIHWSVREVLKEKGFDYSFEYRPEDGWPYTLIKW